MKTTLGDSHKSWSEENKDKSTIHQEENKDKNSTEDASNDKDYLLSAVDYEGFAFVQDQVILYINYINAKAGVQYSWILLDSQSIVELFPNKNLLKNICLMSSDITQEKSLLYSRFNVDVATALVTTAEDLINRYNVREYSCSKKARSLKNILIMPSTKDLINLCRPNMLPNFHVTGENVLTAEDILGPNFWSLKGKMTWHTHGKI